MINQFLDISSGKVSNNFTQALRYLIKSLRKKAHEPETTPQIVKEVKIKLARLEKKVKKWIKIYKNSKKQKKIKITKKKPTNGTNLKKKIINVIYLKKSIYLLQ